ncbi:MAG TPA: DUF4282 domain-containing protein [Trebonia sp.]|nr:DUF4282 domain-containing protein [Trebonia sp.]
MAGQSSEPGYPPPSQDQELTQGRPLWQQSTYTPPAGSAAGQENTATAYAYGQQPGQGFAPSYPPGGQGYGSAGQAAYQAYQAPGYGAQPGQGQGQAPGAAQWQFGGAAPAARPKQPKQPGEKGFFGSLFDFSFSSMVTPKIIKVLYVLFTVWTALVALVVLVIGFRTGGLAGGLFTLIIIDPILVLLTLGIYRVILEAFMVIFRIYEETKKIREGAGNQSQS